MTPPFAKQSEVGPTELVGKKGVALSKRHRIGVSRMRMRSFHRAAGVLCSGRRPFPRSHKRRAVPFHGSITLSSFNGLLARGHGGVMYTGL